MKSKHGSKARSAIFASQGEDAFRDVEAEVVDAVTQRPLHVIATGGGAVLRAANRTC